MSAPPFMQVYIAEYTADTQHLTCEEDGAYWRLLRSMWRSQGKLPNDPKLLARICGITPARWARIGPTVMALFRVDGAHFTQKRLAVEFEKAAEKSSKRAQAGALGGKATALKSKETAPAKEGAMPQHSLELEQEVKEESPSGDSTKSLDVTKPKKPVRTKRCPTDWEPSDTHRAIALEFHLTGAECRAELETFRDHEFKTAHTDWDAAFRNWLRRYGKDKNRGSKRAGVDADRHLGKLGAMARGAQAALDRGGGRWSGV